MLISFIREEKYKKTQTSLLSIARISNDSPLPALIADNTNKSYKLTMYEFNIIKEYKIDFLDKTGVNFINFLVKMKQFLNNITALSLNLMNHRIS